MIFQILIARRDDGGCLAGNAYRESQQDVTNRVGARANRVGARVLLLAFSEVFWNQIFFGKGVRATRAICIS